MPTHEGSPHQPHIEVLGALLAVGELFPHVVNVSRVVAHNRPHSPRPYHILQIGLPSYLHCLAVHLNIVIEGEEHLGLALLRNAVAVHHGVEIGAEEVHRANPLFLLLVDLHFLWGALVIPDDVDFRDDAALQFGVVVEVAHEHLIVVEAGVGDCQQAEAGENGAGWLAG